MTDTGTPPLFNAHDVVALKREVPGLPRPAGTRGTVHLMRRGNPHLYLVELDQAGQPEKDDGLYDVDETDLVLVQAAPNPQPWD